MCSVILFALLCKIVTWSEGKQGSGRQSGQSPVEHSGTFIRPSILTSPPQALSGLESEREDVRPERA